MLWFGRNAMVQFHQQTAPGKLVKGNVNIDKAQRKNHLVRKYDLSTSSRSDSTLASRNRIDSSK